VFAKQTGKVPVHRLKHIHTLKISVSIAADPCDRVVQQSTRFCRVKRV